MATGHSVVPVVEKLSDTPEQPSEPRRDSWGRLCVKKRGPKPGVNWHNGAKVPDVSKELAKVTAAAAVKAKQEADRAELVAHLHNDDQKRFLLALEKSLGVVAKASQITGIHRNRHYEWLEEKTYDEAFRKICELKVDLAEQSLLKLVAEGHPGSVQFLLTHMGKHRGYSSKVEVEHSGNVGFSAAEIIKQAKEAINARAIAKEAPKNNAG